MLTDKRVEEIVAMCEEYKGKNCPADGKAICWELQRYREDIPYLLEKVKERDVRIKQLMDMLVVDKDS